jgi:hypothetical protein
VAPLRRILAALSQLALLLPFVLLKNCSTHRVTSLTGVEVVTRGGAPWLLLTTVLAALFLWRPVSPVRAIGEPVRALGALLGAVTVVAALLYVGGADDTSPRVGAALSFGAWAALWITALAVGFRPPFGGALGPLVATPGLIGAAVGLARRDASLVLGSLITTAVVVVPLLPLFGALRGRARSAAWWIAAALALGGGVVAYPEGVAFTLVGVSAALLGAWRALGL